MQYSVQNKTKAFKGLCLIISLIIALGNIAISNAEQKISYANYPVLRGTTNPQEIKQDLNIKDANKDLRQMSLATYLGVFKEENAKIYPQKQLTNLDTIKALTKLTGQDKDMEQKTTLAYQEKALDMGLVTENELKNDKKFFSNKTTMRKLNEFFSKIVNIDTRYKQQPNQIARRIDLANMIYDNKEIFLKQRNIEFYSGEVLNKSSIIEDGKNKVAITVKLDKNIVIKKVEADKKEKNNEKEEKKSYKENQVEKLFPDNQDEKTTASYLNILSQKDVPVLTPTGITTDTSKLIAGTNINIYSKNNQILYVEQYRANISRASGMLENIIIDEKEPLLNEEKDNKKDQDKADNPVSIIKIKDFDDKTRIYKLHPDVKIEQASGEFGDKTAIKKPVDMEQLSYGQDVTLEIKNNVITNITGYVPVEEELNGFVPEESQIQTGTVLDVKLMNLTLTNNKTYTISPDTLIMKDGKIQDYKAIKDGDKVKLLFDDLYSNIPSKIEVAGNQEQADKILKAKVGPYSLTKKSLTLKDVKELVGNTWIKSQAPTSYENVRVKGNIYANSKKISNNRIKNYNDQDIYVVLAKNQGIPTIEKGKIRIGDSLNFNNSVKNIDYAQNTLQIDENLVRFDDSTIVVKDGNIVTPSNIKNSINTFIETNLMKAAQIIVQNGDDINIDEIFNYPYKIYRATLRDVFDDTILLGNDIENGRKVNHFFMWQGGSWKRFSQGASTPKLKYTQQTKIYDFDNDKAITVDNLREQQYKLNALGQRPKYFDRQVYVITKDDIVKAIAVSKSSGYLQVNSQNTMVAKAVDTYEIKQEDDEKQDGDKNKEQKIVMNPILVKNIYQYNSYKNMLQPIAPLVTTDKNTQQAVKTPVRKLINIQNAIVIYDSKVLPKDKMQMLKDKKLTIIYRQTRDKKLIDDMETIDAIVVIAE